MAQREAVALSVQEIIGSPFFSSGADGMRVYEVVRENLLRNEYVVLSFEGARDLTMVFLVTSIGSLVGDFSPDFVESHVSYSGLSPGAMARVRRAISTSSTYYADPIGSVQALRESSGEYDIESED